MAPVLGIDLGTTNSVVAVADGQEVRVLPDESGQTLLPSVVSFHPEGDVLVGYAARDRRLLDAENTIYSVKRLLGRPWGSPEVERARQRFAFAMREGPNSSVLVESRGQTFTLPEISAFVLREVRRLAESALGEEVSRAVITVPANFNELQRSATKAAGKVAGLEVMRILNEPTAAALAYGYGAGQASSKRRERVAVYDLGGGTFDITILELAGDVFEVLATAGDTFLGGDDVDLAIAERMAESFAREHRIDLRADVQAFERLRAAGEWAKCQLSSEPEVKLRVQELAFGPRNAALDLDFALRRDELDVLARPLIDRTLEVCDEALKVARLGAFQLDHVILVGGSTRIPLVRQRVAEHFGRPTLATIDPDVVVAQGAALHGHALATVGSRLSTVPAAQPVGRVTLRRQPVDGPQDERRRALAAEAAAARPEQPAFAPDARARQVPPVLPNTARVEESGDEPTRVQPPLSKARIPSSRPARPGAPPSVPVIVQKSAMVTVGGSGPPSDLPAPRRALPEGDSPDLPAPRRAGAPPLPNLPAPRPSGPPPLPHLPTPRHSAPPPLPDLPAPRRAAQPVPDLPDPRPASSAAELQAPRRSAAPPPPALPATRPAAPAARPPSIPAPPPDALPVPLPMGAPMGGLPSPPFGASPPFAQQGPGPQPPPPPAAPAAPSLEAQGLPAALVPPAAWPSPPSPLAPSDPFASSVPFAAAPAAAPPFVPATPVANTFPMHGGPTPLLLDVTPQALGVETVDGYCESVIPRNAAIPVEKSRVFTTGADDQEVVIVRVMQGESRRTEQNQELGRVELSGLRRAKRGAVKIEVRFVMSADGTLGVQATDLETGRAQATRIQLVGGSSEAEIAQMAARQQALLQGPRA